MSALCKNCRHEASQHTPQVVYDGPPELLKCKRCVACYPTTRNEPTPQDLRWIEVDPAEHCILCQTPITDTCLRCDDPLTPTEVMRGQLWCGSCTAKMMMVPAEEIAPMNNSIPDARANKRQFRKTLKKHFVSMTMWEEE